MNQNIQSLIAWLEDQACSIDLSTDSPRAYQRSQVRKLRSWAEDLKTLSDQTLVATVVVKEGVGPDNTKVTWHKQIPDGETQLFAYVPRDLFSDYA